MEKLGVIEPIQEPTAWVSHMVPSRKKDGSIRLCIDPVHLNKALVRPHCPVKTIEDILSNMPNAKVFSILDAKICFWQLPLDEESSLLTSFITPIDSYKFLRMPSQIAFLRWPNVGSTLYTTMAHGRHTTLDQCSFDRWRMVG